MIMKSKINFFILFFKFYLFALNKILSILHSLTILPDFTIIKTFIDK